MTKVAHVVTHNKELKFISLEGEEAAHTKMGELEATYNIEKDFQVSASDKWEVLEVPCG